MNTPEMNNFQRNEQEGSAASGISLSTVILLAVALAVILISVVLICVKLVGSNDGVDVPPVVTTGPSSDNPGGVPSQSIQLLGIEKGSLIVIGERTGYKITEEQLALWTDDLTALTAGTLQVLGNVSVRNEVVTALNAFGTAYTAVYPDYKLFPQVGYVGKAESYWDVNAFGGSDFHTGYTFNLNVYKTADKATWLYTTLSADQKNWIASNMVKYGFVFRYPNAKAGEPGADRTYNGHLFTAYVPVNCVRYVGIPHAQYMTENDLYLEEYWEKLRVSHNYGQMRNIASEMLTFEATDADGITATYGVFFVDKSYTKITVPAGYTYVSQSGDNVTGYIVTVKQTATVGTTADPAVTTEAPGATVQPPANTTDKNEG